MAVPPDGPPFGPATAAAQIDFQPLRLAQADAAGMASAVSHVSWANTALAFVHDSRRCNPLHPVALTASMDSSNWSAPSPCGRASGKPGAMAPRRLPVPGRGYEITARALAYTFRRIPSMATVVPRGPGLLASPIRADRVHQPASRRRQLITAVVPARFSHTPSLCPMLLALPICSQPPLPGVDVSLQVPLVNLLASGGPPPPLQGMIWLEAAR